MMKWVHQTGHQAVHQKPKPMRLEWPQVVAMEVAFLVMEDDQAVEDLLEVEDNQVVDVLGLIFELVLQKGVLGLVLLVPPCCCPSSATVALFWAWVGP